MWNIASFLLLIRKVVYDNDSAEDLKSIYITFTKSYLWTQNKGNFELFFLDKQFYREIFSNKIAWSTKLVKIYAEKLSTEFSKELCGKRFI